ncbi:MAG TPA: TonB-dependent receptor [Vicinamibacterales bacterium]|nr:TonB-dependent receptor [Vicinamibacterales bacterium]
MKRVVGWMVSVVFVLVTASNALAQATTSGTGAINGRVSDNSGAVMPGVTVTITSPSMMGGRTAVTDEGGQYRFTAVPPGDYAITFELAGFTNVRNEGVRISVGFTATVNAEMKLASLTESITVTGQSPVVDTAATQVGTTFDAKQLSALPTSRDYFSLLAGSPAVSMSRIDVGGSTNGTQQAFVTYGTSGQVRASIEGINATEATGAFGNYPDVGAMEEVQINTAAHSAEASTPGVQSQFISKSGGNEYRGTYFGSWSPESWQAYNIDQDQIDRGLQAGGGLQPRDVNRLSSYNDNNIGYGGHLGKDKLWFYGSYRHQDIKARFVNYPVGPQQTQLNNFSGKLTYNLSQNNKLIGYTQPSQKKQPQRFDSFLLAVDTGINTSTGTTWNQNFWAWVHKGEWNGVLSDNAFAEVRGGQYGYDWDNADNWSDSEATAGPIGVSPLRFEDVGNNLIYGRNRNWRRERRRNQVLGTVSLFKGTDFGDHNFKVGGEIFRETVNDIYIDGYEQDILHRLNNGAPDSIYIFQAPNTSQNGLWTYGMFFNDSWRMSNRLTLNVGVRYDRYRAFLPEQVHDAGRYNPAPISFAENNDVVHFNNFAPRLGMTYDLRGNGKTVAKFNYGQYWWNPGADFLFNVNENSNAWWTRYRWTDNNGDRQWNPGEEGTILDRRGGAAIESLDPNLKNTRTDEIATFLEQEVIPNFGVRVGYVWRGQRNQYARVNANQPYAAFNVPVTVQDPGPDGRVGTSDDGGTFQAWNLDPAYLTLPVQNITTNVPDGDADFHTFEVTGTKRMSNRWSLLASYGYTRSYDNNNTVYQGNTVRNNALPATPNDKINTSDGRHLFSRQNVKLSGTWNSPWWDITFSPMLRYQEGYPFGRTFQTTLNYNTVRFLAEPMDSQNQDAIWITDLRVEKAVRFPSRRDVSVFFDLYNMFNANPAQNLQWSSGTAYNRPLSVVPPRLARLGVKLNF